MAPIPKKPLPPKQQTLPKPQPKQPSPQKQTSPQKQPLAKPPPKVSPAAPSKRLPSPAPSRRLPSPAPSRRRESPAPSKRLPSPAPSRRQPSPAPSKRQPSPAPSKPAQKTLPKKQPPPPLQPVQPVPPTICEPPSESTSPLSEAVPGPALGAAVVDELARSLSTASSLSHGSATTRDSRESMGSEASAASRQSSGSYNATPAAAVSSAASSVAPSSTASSSVPPAVATSSASSMLTPFPTLPVDTQPSTPLTPSSQQHVSKRRGYVRPQGTDFAASARQRESVLSLGSIAHLQHYFARTGLLDLKGQLERRRRRGGPNGKARTLDLSQLDPASYLNYGGPPTTNNGSKKARPVSMLALPTYILNDGESPLDAPANQEGETAAEGGEEPQDEDADYEEGDDDDNWYGDEDDEEYDPAEMLPPTVSTYQNREKPVAKPPLMSELRADLKESLDNAVNVLADARAQGSRPPTATALSAAAKGHQHTPSGGSIAGLGAVAAWYEVQGMHILDVLTLAIRAAKLYYTGHEYPDRLDTIKPEREVRSELLGVMDVLRRMATRNFAGGVRPDELTAMDDWITGLYDMLEAEAKIVAAERAERASWSWMRDEDWPVVPAGEIPAPADRARAFAREHAFMESMFGDKAGELPEWEPLDRTAADAAAAVAAESEIASASATASIPSPKADGEAPPPDAPPPPTAFLHHMQTGVRLVELHNCAVRRSHRRFGAIPTFHANTQKPYRAADNLRFWGKAAELRWEVMLKIDALGIVYNTGPIIWADFEDAIYHWCRKVREELASETDE